MNNQLSRIILASCAAMSILLAPLAQADTNKALEAWKAYAASSGNPNHQKWVDEISKPEAIALAKEWKDLRGYDSYDLMEKANLPADLKPGLKITKDNAAQFPWLKDYLPAEILEHLSSDWSNIKEITIVPTNTYYMHKGYLAGTKELKEKGIELQINARGELIYPDGSYALMSGPGATSIPFLNPKTGLELNWSYVAHSVNTDTLDFEPIHMRACTANGKLDSEYKADLWWWHYHNRQQGDAGPVGSIDGKEDYIEGGSIFFLEPNDIRGLAGVRQRYPQADKDDDFKVFIPSLRRTRLLTGSDAQDPIASGQELTWDDWRAYWGKTDVTKFDYEIAGEGWILASPEVGYIYDSAVLTDDQCNYKSLELELRPVWILDIKDKTGKYMYANRRTWVDKEFYYMQYHITEDQRGNRFRNWEDSRAWRPTEGDSQWRYVMVNNYITKRMSTLFMQPQWDERDDRISEEMFDVDQLRDYK
ncbi:MAG TPA: outer membrane lipoprotein-sorting protein [Thiotrichaceae bacterium]|nr:outer membrane lipoprotein-sorting protein [Thiotrichaceae bacterium]HIM08065.1 outer membrane lipoprotein-sorting protein [Gammaproteobacteria bacterium]